MANDRKVAGLCWVPEARCAGKTLGRLVAKMRAKGACMDGEPMEVIDFHTGEHMYDIRYDPATDLWSRSVTRVRDGTETTAWLIIAERVPRRSTPRERQ